MVADEKPWLAILKHMIRDVFSLLYRENKWISAHINGNVEKREAGGDFPREYVRKASARR